MRAGGGHSELLGGSPSISDIGQLQDTPLLLTPEVHYEGAITVAGTQPVSSLSLSGVVLEHVGHAVSLVEIVAGDDFLLAVSRGRVVEIVRNRNCLVNLVD